MSDPCLPASSALEREEGLLGGFTSSAQLVGGAPRSGIDDGAHAKPAGDDDGSRAVNGDARSIALRDGPGSWHLPYLWLLAGSVLLAVGFMFGSFKDELTHEPVDPGALVRLSPTAILLVLLGLLPILRVGARGVVRSTLLLRLVARVAPRWAARFEAHVPYADTMSLTFFELIARPDRSSGLAVGYHSLTSGQRLFAAWQAYRSTPAVQVTLNEGSDVLPVGACCPYCKDRLAGASLHTCAACRVAHHVECLAAHGGCATLGCAEGPGRPAAPRALDEPGGGRSLRAG